MSKGKRFNILVVAKKSMYIEKFRGLRKNKFQVHSVANLLQQSTIELDEVDTFFLVLYNFYHYLGFPYLYFLHNLLVFLILFSLFRPFN